eukprot:357327-Chlamydomonas_euryale.AAC.7
MHRQDCLQAERPAHALPTHGTLMAHAWLTHGSHMAHTWPTHDVDMAYIWHSEAHAWPTHGPDSCHGSHALPMATFYFALDHGQPTMLPNASRLSSPPSTRYAS